MWILTVLISGFLSSLAKQSCFPHLDCFNYTSTSFMCPYLPPDAPENVITKVLFSSRRTLDASVTIYPDIDWKQVFDPKLDTYFIVHGWLGRPEDPRISQLRDNLLQWGDLNVFVADWSSGTAGTYPQAVANSRTMAKVVGRFVNFLKTNHSAQLRNMEFIGHSLGAQAAAFCVKSFKGEIGRLTGLDPAGPCFTRQPPDYRMSKGDAVYTKAIHTNAGAFGTPESIADVDIFVNGGIVQPQCFGRDIIFNPIRLSERPCSHGLAYNYYISSINDCPFWSKPVRARPFVTGTFRTMLNVLPWMGGPGRADKDCIPLGPMSYSEPFRNRSGVFSVNTWSQMPYC